MTIIFSFELSEMTEDEKLDDGTCDHVDNPVPVAQLPRLLDSPRVQGGLDNRLAACSLLDRKSVV